MGPRDRRALLALLVVVATAVVSRAEFQAVHTYGRERERTTNSIAVLRETLQLVGSTGEMRRAFAARIIADTARPELLKASNAAAAIAELAHLIVDAVDVDALTGLTLLPERDSTALETLHRAALKVRFEADTETLIQLLEVLLAGGTLVRVDALQITALPNVGDLGSARLAIEARISAWFSEARS